MLPDQKWLTNCVCVCVYVCEDSGEIPCVLRKVSKPRSTTPIPAPPRAGCMVTSGLRGRKLISGSVAGT